MKDKIDFDTDDILEALSEVVDPEVNVPILEMGDPENYISPDVVVDFTSIHLVDIENNKVLVRNFKLNIKLFFSY